MRRAPIQARTAASERLLGARIFEGVVLDQLSAFRSKAFREVSRDVLADYGSFTERRLHRALARLIQRGAVIRTGGGSPNDWAYRRAAPALAAEDVA